MGMLLRRYHETSPTADGPAFPDGQPDKSWKKDQLVAYALDKGVDVTGASTKDEILALLEPLNA